MTQTELDFGLATVSPGLAAVAAYLANRKIESEYGRGSEHDVECEARRVGEVVALAELPEAFGQGINGFGADLAAITRRSQAHHWLSALVAEALQARLCQCTGAQHLQHERHLPCTGHFESDVPELEGKFMCGGCHISVWQASPQWQAANAQG